VFEVQNVLWLIPGLPLAASVITLCLGPRLLRQQSHWPCVLAVAASFLLSLGVCIGLIRGPQTEAHETGLVEQVAEAPDSPATAPPVAAIKVHWFQAGGVDISLSLRADTLTAMMLVTITFVGGLIAVYSIGYMSGDPGHARFFAEISLFIFSMTGLVLADNFILLYAFWEGVGLCSYLLIGFWFTRPAAAAAARKAFLVTRIGDTGFLLGIILLWINLGYSVDYEGVFRQAAIHPGIVPVVCVLLFSGAVGKSAQFPLHVWLPDAMEGPTPVSALIHAATMVTAGVYLVARCMPLFSQAPAVLALVASIGAFTALLAAAIALTQTDLKRVLAYSTISQLGYMFLALGSATARDLVAVAVMAAMFHLFTHAFFKALLFLSAGSVMHAMGNVIDMRRLGGLRHVMPITHWTFLCGALALAGFPLFSGFWSKDEVLASAWTAATDGAAFSRLYMALFLAALITAGLTGFYTFRAYFLIFWGEKHIPPEAGDHAHESPRVMTVPLVILAAGAAALGIIVEPITHWFSRFLARTPSIGPVHEHAANLSLMLVSSVVALAGIAAAWWIYVSQPGLADTLALNWRRLYQLSRDKFMFDEIYEAVVVTPLTAVARLIRAFDLNILDGLVDLIGNLPRLFGGMFRPMQNGLVQFYALAMALGLTVFLIALVRAMAG
jgi:NADH-quinone oxidoreductase subunit L